MKTTYTIMAILATLLFTQTVTAKLGSNNATVQLESKIKVNVEAEIINNINEMLENIQAQTIKTDVAKTLDISTVQLQTNELVQNASKNLPEFKFKVVIAD